MPQTVQLATKGHPLTRSNEVKLFVFCVRGFRRITPNKLPFLPIVDKNGLLATLTQRKFAFLFFGWFLIQKNKNSD